MLDQTLKQVFHQITVQEDIERGVEHRVTRSKCNI